MHSEVILSDGEPCQVRRLGLFELDNIRLETIGPFTFQDQTLTGDTFDIEYDGSQWVVPPERPDKPIDEIEEGSDEWYQLREAQLYEGWVNHEKRRIEDVARYCREVASYILTEAISETDRERIYTEGDWERVHFAALTPQVRMEDIADVLRDTFPGYI